MGDRNDAVLIEQRDSVLTIVLNRPDVRNALTADLEAGLIDALRHAGESDVRAVVLTARGPVFCAGANTKELAGNEDRHASALRVRARELPETVLLPLMRLEKPVVAALNGPAVGAGIGLALAADFRVCAESAAFVFAFRRVALAPDLGTCWTLPRIVGHRVARDLLMFGPTVSSHEALDMGLADRVVADADLAEASHDLACELAQGPTLALGLTKLLLRRAHDLDLEQFLEHEVLVQSVLVRSEDHQEGVTALKARRAPEFRGH